MRGVHCEGDKGDKGESVEDAICPRRQQTAAIAGGHGLFHFREQPGRRFFYVVELSFRHHSDNAVR